MTEQSNAELAMTKNIVEMAFDFTAMVRVLFQRPEGEDCMNQSLEEQFSMFGEASNTREDYEAFLSDIR